MNKYETLLFEVAPWSKEIMLIAKEINSKSFMRGRTGWTEKNISNPESIYEHSCKVALAAYYLFGTKKAIDMALIHDFAEIFEPDYIPWKVDQKYKHEKELEAMGKLKKILPNGKYWFELWEEFELKEGLAFYINQLDKICPSIQAINYYKNYKKSNLEEFQPYALTRVKTSELRNILEKFTLDYTSKYDDAYEDYYIELKKLKLIF